MRLHRFFIPFRLEGNKNITVTSPEVIHQWKKVFRFVTGDSVIIFDGTGIECVCEISHIEKDHAKLLVKETRNPELAPKKEIYLYASLVKRDTFEWIVEKATELGVSHIVPVISERSEKKNVNSLRLAKISIEASEQSGRVTLPVIAEPILLEDALNFVTLSSDMQPIAFSGEGKPFDAKVISDSNKTVAIFIGPEGGYSSIEIEKFVAQKIPVYSLGKQVLRAETAAVAVLSLILL